MITPTATVLTLNNECDWYHWPWCDLPGQKEKAISVLRYSYDQQTLQIRASSLEKDFANIFIPPATKQVCEGKGGVGGGVQVQQRSTANVHLPGECFPPPKFPEKQDFL